MLAVNDSILGPKNAEVTEETIPEDGPWIGADLDGTLAKHDLWLSHNHIGKPIPQMMKRVKSWIEQGIRVKIVTSRASDPKGILSHKKMAQATKTTGPWSNEREKPQYDRTLGWPGDPGYFQYR